MNFVSGWNQLIGKIPGGVLTVLTIIGVALIVIFVAKWIWGRRRGGGGGMSGFPWLAIIFGAILAGPTVTVPAILTILQALVNVVINLATWVGGLLG